MNKTTRDAPARNPHRCKDCLSPSAAASLEAITPPRVNRWFLTATGTCGRCKTHGDVFDVAFLVIQHWKGELFSAEGAVVGQRRRPEVPA